ncbi:MAG TPA: CRTAC1 family protein [Parafilimonas sp.]|nr:CRTAC1 family protein [Parafilimonas sp.]
MKPKKILFNILPAVIFILYNSCNDLNHSNRQMITLLASIAETENNAANGFAPGAQLTHLDSLLSTSNDEMQTAEALYTKACVFLQLGDEESSEVILKKLLSNKMLIRSSGSDIIKKALALTYLRIGEKTNCIYNHGVESCIFPIQGKGVHHDKSGSAKAIEIYESLLKLQPNDLESRWLLNIAYMTMGKYPQGVPGAYIIKGLDSDTSHLVKPFIDAAVNTGLNTKNMAGGSIIEDFNNDGYLDIVTSGWDLTSHMHYCCNNGNGSFRDVSDLSGLRDFTGGLNIMQTDYNNDGLKDLFVLRGAWKGSFGREPNSLLRNNGDGTFTDVTKQSRLLSFHPTQTATWNDFNNDGWLDVFIGNESSSVNDGNTCELYLNNKNGTFTNIAAESNTNINAFVKGVTSGDYDNDGWPDIFVSTLNNKKVLLKNEGIKNGIVHFEDVTTQAGLDSCNTKTFSTWFWDYDNDGWLDLFVSNYDFYATLAWYAAAEALHLKTGNAAKQYLFHNNHDGTFTDITAKAGLNRIAFAMGANFGDIDNDGYPDIYMGTGNPNYQSLVPNKMFKNEGGKHFADVTAAARVGNLQKGHGVSFADLDNDGDEDIYIEMGGAYRGDAYQNSLYINPGQNNNRWINISLEGVTCNRAAIGARIKVTFKENGMERSVYHDVNSGGSFGANPLMQHIGIGQATSVDSIEIKWPLSNMVQVFKQVKPGINIHIKEGVNSYTTKSLAKCDFLSEEAGLISCGVPLKF